MLTNDDKPNRQQVTGTEAALGKAVQTVGCRWSGQSRESARLGYYDAAIATQNNLSTADKSV